MLVTVKKSKLVLGRTVYLKGDVFECRDAEAKILIATGMVAEAPVQAKATKAAPTPPTTGLSVKPGGPPASKQVMAPRAMPSADRPVPRQTKPIVLPVTKSAPAPTPVPSTQIQSQPESDPADDERSSTASSFTPVFDPKA